MNNTNLVTRQPVLTGGITGGVLSALVVMLFGVLKSYGVNITPELETSRRWLCK